MKSLFSLLHHYVKTKYFNRFKNRADLVRWQNKKVEKHIKWVHKKSKFYKIHHIGFAEKDWRTFPIIDKTTMMDNFNTLNTLNITKENAFKVAMDAEDSRDFSPTINGVTIGLSSGTSGNRGIFLVSPDERYSWAGAMIAKVLPHSIFSNFKNRVAFFMRANSNLYDSVGSRKIKFDFFDLLDDFDNHVNRLNRQQPTLLVAPPSMLLLLSKEIEKGTLQISPKKIISVAEVLDPIDELRIEKMFKQKVHQVYQCTEGFLACTCNHGNLHLNEDIVVIQKEYIDDTQTKFIPIITDFSRFSQPIIRYRLNDILTENKEPCPCGSVFTRIEYIEGRADDIFYFRHISELKNVQVFPDYMRRTIISSSEHIEEYRIVQHNLSHIEISLVVKDEYKNEIEVKLNKDFNTFFNNQNCVPPKITFSYQIEKSNVKKLKRVEQLIDYKHIL